VVSSFEHLLRDEPLTPFSNFLWSVGPVTVRAAGRLAFSMRIELQGDLPPPPYVVAANHYSHLDPVAVGASLGNPIRFLAVDELFGISAILDRLLSGFGVIPISRSRVPIRTLRVALARLEAGEIVGVFPDGTRVSRWGDLPPKRGAAWLAVRANVPLLPVAVVGTDRAFGVDNRWHRAHIHVVGRPFGPRLEDASTLTTKWECWVTEQLARSSRSHQ